MRRITVVALAGVLLATTGAPGGDAQTPPPTTTTATTAVAHCSVSQTAQRRYARRVYHRSRVGKHAVWRLDHMRACARSARAASNMLRVQRAQARARHQRLAMACGTPTCNRRLVLAMGGPCLVSIVHAETGGTFSHTIQNRSSGAYGLPQALPGSKMASAGRDWATNPRTQIRWMLGYVSKYGGPCSAWSFWQSHSWY